MSQTKHPLESVSTNPEPPTKRPRCDEIVTDDDIFEHGREVIECDVCGMFFLSQANLEAHQQNHLLQRDYRCRTCHKSYTTADGLKLHARSAHTELCDRITQQGGGVAPSGELGQVCLNLSACYTKYKTIYSFSDAQV